MSNCEMCKKLQEAYNEKDAKCFNAEGRNEIYRETMKEVRGILHVNNGFMATDEVIMRIDKALSF